MNTPTTSQRPKETEHPSRGEGKGVGLSSYINSRYIEAANALRGKSARRRIVAYVESYDDVYFWRTVLSRFENEKRYFEVMLPSKKTLTRGKKSVLMNFLKEEGEGRKEEGGRRKEEGGYSKPYNPIFGYSYQADPVFDLYICGVSELCSQSGDTEDRRVFKVCGAETV